MENFFDGTPLSYARRIQPNLHLMRVFSVVCPRSKLQRRLASPRLNPRRSGEHRAVAERTPMHKKSGKPV
jgi:hypothetical protein